jgi:DNA-binding PadR family transcriptional regulator
VNCSSSALSSSSSQFIGQIYQTLGRLERGGLVRSATVTQGSRPDKRVYELTPAGREELQRWVDGPLPAARVRDTFFSKLMLAWKVRLAVEAAVLHVQADLKLLEFCEQAVSADDPGSGG